MQQQGKCAVVPKNGDLDYNDFLTGTTNFNNDKRIGDWGESRFEKWMHKQGMHPIKQDGNKHWDYNLICDDGYRLKFEIKHNYKNDGKIVIEEWSNIDVKRGWIYTCDADVLVTMSTITMIWISLPRLQQKWNSIKDEYVMHTNNSNTRNNYVSAYYRIRLEDIIDKIGANHVQEFRMN